MPGWAVTTRRRSTPRSSGRSSPASTRPAEGFTLVSEELGVRDGGDTWVVLDPIDGSINAKRGLPFFSLSVAVAEGGTMDDVDLRLRLRLRHRRGVDGRARRRREAERRTARAASRPKDRIEILALEATRTDLVARHAPALVGLVHRLRVFGSLAISLCHLADGRVDAVCSLKPARAVDIAAAQLLVRERGYAIDLPEAPPFEDAPLDLEGRSRVVAAGTTELCATVAAALSA